MGLFGKLAFWKKKDELADFDKELGLGPTPGADMGLGMGSDFGAGMGHGFEQPPMQQPPQQFQPSFQPQTLAQPPPQPRYERDYMMEAISSKLDALRASLDNINQRLASLEAMARGEQETEKRRHQW